MQFSKWMFLFFNNLVGFITEPFSIFSSCLLPLLCYTEAAEYLKRTKLDLSPEENCRFTYKVITPGMKLPLKAQFVLHQNVFLLRTVFLSWEEAGLAELLLECSHLWIFFNVYFTFSTFHHLLGDTVPYKSSCSIA